MRATARLVAECDGTGATRLAVLHGEAPLLPRLTGPGEVHLVGGAAGPLGGDQLFLEVTVCAGARLTVRSVAATVALPGPGWSRLSVSARVETGGRLEWLPEPLIAAARCSHEMVSTVDLAAGAALVWREELVCGRHGEEPGDARLLTSVRLDGRPLYAGDLAVGPSAPSWSGPAVLGGARVYGSVLYVGCPPVSAGGTVMRLAEPGGVLVTALGPDLPEVRGALGAVRPR
jgi:urease accessory protein